MGKKKNKHLFLHTSGKKVYRDIFLTITKTNVLQFTEGVKENKCHKVKTNK